MAFSRFPALIAAVLLVATAGLTSAEVLAGTELPYIQSVAEFLNATSLIPVRPTAPPKGDLGLCTTSPLMYPTPGYKPSIDMTGRVVVVTGASKGIGLQVAIQLKALGAVVYGTSRTPSAYPDSPVPLLTLDQADPVSVAAFAAQVAALPEVVARGGLDALVANAGRLVFGNQIPPFQDTTQYYAGLQLAVQTIYIGNLRVINSLLPLVQSAAAARPDQYGRIVVTVSPAGYANGGMDMFDFYVGPYIENKRALLAAVNTLRGGLAFQKSPVKVSTVNPFITNTTITDGLNPIYQQPVDASGNSLNDPQFQAFLNFTRNAANNGQPASLTAAAHVQLLTMVKPPPNVAAGTYKPVNRLRGTDDVIRVIFDLENAQSAFPYVIGGPSLAAASSLATDKQVAVTEAAFGLGARL